MIVGDVQRLKDRGVRIMVVGMTGSINVNEILGIASEPKSENTYFVNDFKDLEEDRNITDSIVGGMCGESESSTNFQ